MAAQALGEPQPEQQGPFGAVRGEHVLLSLLRWLPLPWDAPRLAPVCRAWAACIAEHGEFWVSLTPRRSQLPALNQLLQTAGRRLRKLDLSGVGKEAGPLPGLAESLRCCPCLEELNVAGCQELTELPEALSQSLRSLNIRGCGPLHRALPSVIGAPLRHLEAGWLSEMDEQRDWDLWPRVFPRRLFQQVCRKCPNLVTLRVPGYALLGETMNAQLLSQLAADYRGIAEVATLRGLRRLDLCYTQALGDDAVVRIAAGCSRLRSLNLRCCTELTDRALLAVAQHLREVLVHINISCCEFSERAARRLVTNCRHLKTLDVCYCPQLKPAFVAFLCADPALCPQLRMLGAGGLDVGDAELGAICDKYRDLTHLGIGSAKRLTDAGLHQLTRLTGLRKLSAHQLSGVSCRGLIELCERAPGLQRIDAECCSFSSPAQSDEDFFKLSNFLAERRYSYDDSDSETDVESEPPRQEPPAPGRRQEPLSGWAQLPEGPA